MMHSEVFNFFIGKKRYSFFVNVLSMDDNRHYCHCPEFLYLKECRVLSIKSIFTLSTRKSEHNSNCVSNYTLVYLSWDRNRLSDTTFLAKLNVGKGK